MVGLEIKSLRQKLSSFVDNPETLWMVGINENVAFEENKLMFAWQLCRVDDNTLIFDKYF